MKNGEVQPNGDTDGRRLMGWGLLDRRGLLMTEDKEAGMLQAILVQWPDLDRHAAVWPFDGLSKLPSPIVVSGLVTLTGGNLKVLLHRDRDFLMPEEITHCSRPYSDAGHNLWFTKASDIEAYWCEADVIASHFKIDLATAQGLLDEAIGLCCEENKDLNIRRRKRLDAINKINASGHLPQYNDAVVEREACRNGAAHKFLGKKLLSAIRKVAQDRGIRQATSFGGSIPPELHRKIAEDLETSLREMLR